MKEAILYKKLSGSLVQCQACNHYCVIADGKRGFCGVRMNKDGMLYSLVYGKVIAVHIDPIEKKPLFHWLPGSYSLSIATVGCNFRCLHCQNYDISQMPRDCNGQIFGEEMSAEEIVDLAIKNNLPSISYTYTEPTVFIEFALETMRLAKKQGLKNNWVTNGYMSKETLEMVAHYLDAANVDLKFFREDLYQKVCGAKLQPVLDSLKWMKKHKIWVEVTTLVIPGYTDLPSDLSAEARRAEAEASAKEGQFEEIAKFIKNELGSETPWHISRFYPAYKMADVLPTPPETIYRAYEIGKKIGLKYVYTGNLPCDKGENTYCPKCGELNIKRIGYEIERFDQSGKCRKCNESLDLILR